MKQYKLYIFDLDLTAVDSLESSKMCYRAAFEACGLTFDESKTNYYLNQNLKETYEEIEKDAPNCGMKFFDAFVEKSATAFAQYAKFYDEIEYVFDKLVENGAKIALFTNRNAHDIQALLDANPNIKKSVCFFVGSDMVQNKKPDPEGINICSEKLNVAKEDILYVGDSPCDYGAARAANVDFYYVDRYNNKAIPVETHDTIEDIIKTNNNNNNKENELNFKSKIIQQFVLISIPIIFIIVLIIGMIIDPPNLTSGTEAFKTTQGIKGFFIAIISLAVIILSITSLLKFADWRILDSNKYKKSVNIGFALSIISLIIVTAILILLFIIC